MELRIQKILYRVVVLLLVGILLLAGALIGMYNERDRLKQQDQAEVVTDIAVVNLDEGIYENGVKTYYSTILMDLEADNLVSENLESARQGILNGNYAAYILIPAEFSQNATSINNVPQKAVLEFAINPNLREDVSRLTMANVKNFEISLNTNMSYMYVQALLSEFHNVQDLSGTILKNDTTEMERLLAVDSNALLVFPEYEEVERVEPDFDEIEFDETFDKNEEILDSVYENYETFVKDGEDAFAAIKEKEETVIDEVETFYEAVSEIDISVDDNGDSVSEDGLETLENYLVDYDVEYEKQKKLVGDIITVLTLDGTSGEDEPEEDDDETGGESEEEDESQEGEDGDDTDTENNTGGENTGDNNDDGFDFDVEIKPVSQIIKENVENSLLAANILITSGNETNSQAISEMQGTIDELKELLSEQADEGDDGDADDEGSNDENTDGEIDNPDSNIETAEEPAPDTNTGASIDTDAVLAKLGELEDQLNQIGEIELIDVEDVYSDEAALEPFQVLTEEVNKIPKVDTQEYRSIFEEEVITPLNEEIESENQKVQEAGETMLVPLEEYITELAEFDLFELYDYDAMDELLEEFGNNIFMLEEQIVDVHGEYEDFVSDTVDQTNETMTTMQEELEDAYEDTAGNVYKEVSLAKEYRESMNEFNTDILGSFRQKLPYTRVGQLEYVQAYDFMVKPIQMSDASIEKNRTVIWQDSDVLRNILISMIAVWCLCICGLLFMRMRSFAGDTGDKE